MLRRRRMCRYGFSVRARHREQRTTTNGNVRIAEQRTLSNGTVWTRLLLHVAVFLFTVNVLRRNCISQRLHLHTQKHITPLRWTRASAMCQSAASVRDSILRANESRECSSSRAARSQSK